MVWASVVVLIGALAFVCMECGRERERGAVDTLALAMGHAADTGLAEELEAPGGCHGHVRLPIASCREREETQ